MMKTEQVRAGEFLLSEAESDRSRSQVTMTAGNYKAGTVVGMVTADGKFTDLKTSGSDGNQNAAGVLLADVDASAADAPGVVIDLDAQVIEELLIWPAGINATQRKNAVSALMAILQTLLRSDSSVATELRVGIHDFFIIQG